MSLQLRERTFEKVGGLQDHIQTLKEMIIYPLMYRELFEAHGIEAPRGVLFHGPPGTGKTLVAGAVAAECSRSTNRRVSFYMRKGADCLNKYFGESEKHLQNLFAQAQNTRPSIIFFDEIDGLVPTRSESQEQVHASVVSTLLALMDGLDSKSEVFVIGATNRIDMIDPALRRPGRFDRELYFPLPPLESRYQIFDIHTKHWKVKPDPEFVVKLASECAGYCGADIQSLCSQAVMESFRRNYPEVSNTSRKFHVNLENVQVTKEDFWAAKEKIVPASQRILTTPSRPLSPELRPLLQRNLDICLNFIQKSCPFKFIHHNRPGFTKNKSITCPRILLARQDDHGHIPHIASAILHAFDHLPVTVIDLPTINEQIARGSDSNSLVHKIKQARQSMPGILYFPDIGSWWELIDETGRMVLLTSLNKLDSNSISQLFFLGTSDTVDYDDLSPDVRKIFPRNRSLLLMGPRQDERYNFFLQLLGKSFVESTYQCKQEVKLECKPNETWDIQNQRRWSRRQKGLDVEYKGITEIKHKPESYVHDFVPAKPKILRNIQHPRFDVSSPEFFKKSPDSFDQTPNKKQKTETPSPAVGFPEAEDGKTVRPNGGWWSKMENLARLCTQVTSNMSTKSAIKLYEQLEIVLLRFGPTWEESRLLQELEREITFFNPS